mgnify:CR=1 FL=1
MSGATQTATIRPSVPGAASAPGALPRELVLASAGTGKTFRISSRILALLAAGHRPETIFAATFTRKAAGEILERVLARLAAAALDDGAAAELAAHTALPPASPHIATPDGWLALLREVIRELHRLNVGTLDAFFVRTAAGFADEAGLPPGWSIADPATTRQVLAEALHTVLAEADAAELIELVRGLAAKDAARSVHDAVLARAEELLALHHALDPQAADAWAGLDACVGAAPAGLAAHCERLAAACEAAEGPRTKAGKPDARWAKALAGTAAALRAGDWDALVEATLFRSARLEGGSYCGQPVPDAVCALMAQAAELARHGVAPGVARQARAMGRLAQRLAGAVERAQREALAVGFGDVTRRLGGPPALCARPDLHYRLDARVQHVLLDEFQDTSLAQWEALEPLVRELLADAAGERAAVVVADPKQSIYAWRGGEPLLVGHVGERYGLARDTLARSWRSSPVVLDAVNRVFARIEENPVLADDALARRVAAEWRAAFAPHQAAKPLDGYVCLQVGPADAGTGEDRPLLCRRAAELVRELRQQAPGCSVGVLTRRNRTVARVMLELRRLGVAASEEGGNPLTDSPAASAVLALLRLADHPGDRVARFHVAQTPLGELVGLPHHDDDRAARHAAHRLRRQLLEEGYGRTLHALARRMAPLCEPRERRRLAQLAELGHRHDARATLRATDFVRVVEAERVEDPSAADVRVMTVHQAKGLEFDLVVLPELDASLASRPGRSLAYRPHAAGRVTRVFPYLGEAKRALFPDAPELHGAAEQAEAAGWRDALSGLYVALTRARHALYVLVKPDGRSGAGSAKSGARLVRHALAPDAPATEGAVLHESGNPDWHLRVRAERAAARAAQARPSPAAEAGAAGEDAPVVLLASGRAGKPRVQVTPSALAGGPRVELRALLRLDLDAAEHGTLAHAWLEQIGWIEDGVPADDALHALARRAAPGMDGDAVEALRRRFRAWLATPAIRRALSRDAYPEGATVEREVPFLHRDDGRLLEGVIDRLVLLREAGRVTRAEILDYKTDALPGTAALAARVEHYRPQLDAYRAAVAALYRLPPQAVGARLVFLDAAAVRQL